MINKFVDKNIIVIDVGNTNTVIAIINDKGIDKKWRLSTLLNRTSDEYKIIIESFLNNELNKKDVTNIIISSVVPSIVYELKSCLSNFFSISPKIIGIDIFPDIDILLDRPDEVGADRLVNSLAAFKLYGGEKIIVDFGTATTLDVIDKKGCYLGGVISPGVLLSMDALDKATARLPRISISAPKHVIGKDTVSAMKSGIYWGYIGLVEGIVGQIKKEYDSNMEVIATGGLANLFSLNTDQINIVDDDLTLKGIALTWNNKLSVFN
tara:strand:+ start:15286 stop:16083 length:798 start_codon:yes stop_codon:yes gene_type:complete